MVNELSFDAGSPQERAGATDFAIGGNYIMAGVQDPTLVPTDAPRGAFYVRAGNDDLTIAIGLYQKQDNGKTTNWLPAGGGGGSGVSLEQGGVPVAGSPFSILNFANLFSIVNAGGGQADLTLLGSGALTPIYHTVTALELAAKQFVFAPPASIPANVLVDIVGGCAQEPGVDFTIIGANVFDWNGLELDGIIAEGDVVRISVQA